MAHDFETKDILGKVEKASSMTKEEREANGVTCAIFYTDDSVGRAMSSVTGSRLNIAQGIACLMEGITAEGFSIQEAQELVGRMVEIRNGGIMGLLKALADNIEDGKNDGESPFARAISEALKTDGTEGSLS